MHTLGGTQQESIINESGHYTLILRSRKPEAKKCKKREEEERKKEKGEEERDDGKRADGRVV